MIDRLPHQFVLSRNIQLAQEVGSPIVALESAVITHGLPQPENFKLARDLEAEVFANGAAPATIAVLDGKIHIGLTDSELETLAHMQETRKISLRDFGIAINKGLSGGTTVAGTLFAASTAHIQVFATGGIGGVHRGSPFDVSADLMQLGKRRVLVVCSGAKSILDLPATREILETQGVPVIGYQTDQFPAFYTPSSGLLVDASVNTPQEAAQIALQTWEAGLRTAVLLVVPPPESAAMSKDAMETAIKTALHEVEEGHIKGGAVTPFLLARLSTLTGGESLQANLALLRNNARIAAQVAVAMKSFNKIGPF